MSFVPSDQTMRVWKRTLNHCSWRN